MPRYEAKWYGREMDAIERVIEGADVSTALDALVEAVDPMPVRKRLRQVAPRLYQWLAQNGTLHDFALDAAAGRMRKPEHFEHKFDIPKSMRAALTTVLGA